VVSSTTLLYTQRPNSYWLAQSLGYTIPLQLSGSANGLSNVLAHSRWNPIKWHCYPMWYDPLYTSSLHISTWFLLVGWILGEHHSSLLTWVFKQFVEYPRSQKKKSNQITPLTHETWSPLHLSSAYRCLISIGWPNPWVIPSPFNHLGQ